MSGLPVDSAVCREEQAKCFEGEGERPVSRRRYGARSGWWFVASRCAAGWSWAFVRNRLVGTLALPWAGEGPMASFRRDGV